MYSVPVTGLYAMHATRYVRSDILAMLAGCHQYANQQLGQRQPA